MVVDPLPYVFTFCVIVGILLLRYKPFIWLLLMPDRVSDTVLLCAVWVLLDFCIPACIKGWGSAVRFAAFTTTSVSAGVVVGTLLRQWLERRREFKKANWT